MANQLITRIGDKEIINSLRIKEVDDLVIKHASDIDTVANVLGIDTHYLSIQVRLMIPFYSEARIISDNSGDGINFIREILIKLRKSLQNFEHYYLYHRAKNGIDELPTNMKIFDKGVEMYIANHEAKNKIYFNTLDSSIGFSIQNNLHYIHKERKDTKFHFGLFLEGKEHPLCYCAISVCDREYQAKALSHSVGENIELNQIYVITRSFGFNPLPHNMMSKLFDQSVKYIKHFHREDKLNYPQYIITALNPFLGFNGSIFLGSSFDVFATSPMEYKYNSEGLYLNRRNSDVISYKQKLIVPPIVWLARPLTKNSRKRIEKMTHYYKITEAEYKME